MREKRMEIYPDHKNSQLLITVKMEEKTIGYVAIDSTVNGRACGGLRFMPDINEVEIQGLAFGMTLKFGFLGLPQGGAKAGIIGDPEAPQEERFQKLSAFGKAIAPLLSRHLYKPATDMGTENRDIQHLLTTAGVHIKKRELQQKHSGYYTAYTVFTGIKSAAEYLGKDLSKCKIAIEGFGKVGSSLAYLLKGTNAKLIAISTSKGAIYNPKGFNIVKLLSLLEEKGSDVVKAYTDAEDIEISSLLELPMDILCPCAIHDCIHRENANRIQAKIISPGANMPITMHAEYILFDREILSLPYFMTNCGGVLGNTMEFASLKREQITRFIDQNISKRIHWIINESLHQNKPSIELAIPYALDHFKKIKEENDHQTKLKQIFEFGLDLYRRGWLPKNLIATASLPYFKKALV